MSWPFRFVVNGIPIRPEEVEEIFRVRIHMTCYSTLCVMGTFLFNSIHELNAICGFNPALDGADICKYFDLFPLEIFGEANDNVTAVVGESFCRSILSQLNLLTVEPRRSSNI